MADEGTVTPGNGTPAPAPVPVADPAIAAREAAVAAGLEVFTSNEMFRLKERAAEKATLEATEYKAQLEAKTAEAAELAQYKTSIENKGKTQAELDKERQRAWEQSDAAKSAAIDASAQELLGVKAELSRERVQNRIKGLMPNSTNSDMAQMWAERHIGRFLSTNEGGDLVWTEPTGVEHIGIHAEKLVSDWWSLDAQKSLHTSNVPGPSTAGAPSAPVQQTTEFVSNPAKTIVENLMDREDWDRKHAAK